MDRSEAEEAAGAKVVRLAIVVKSGPPIPISVSGPAAAECAFRPSAHARNGASRGAAREQPQLRPVGDYLDERFAMRLHDKTVSGNGASLGTGRALALGFPREGARVMVNYNSDETGAGGTAAAVPARHHTRLGRRVCREGAIE